jgi:hypothetical protein
VWPVICVWESRKSQILFNNWRTELGFSFDFYILLEMVFFRLLLSTLPTGLYFWQLEILENHFFLSKQPARFKFRSNQDSNLELWDMNLFFFCVTSFAMRFAAFTITNHNLFEKILKLQEKWKFVNFLSKNISIFQNGWLFKMDDWYRSTRPVWNQLNIVLILKFSPFFGSE